MVMLFSQLLIFHQKYFENEISCFFLQIFFKENLFFFDEKIKVEKTIDRHTPLKFGQESIFHLIGAIWQLLESRQNRNPKNEQVMS